MTVYYNEHDPNAAAWLRELIRTGLIAAGDVDERSIEDVHPDDLRSYRQCHFFAGIGGWSYALRLARWPDDRPVWTGSCPCQPFSAAGKGAGVADERHLWPAFHWLIGQRRPPVVFGEQVASEAGYLWLYGVRADMEGSGYAFGAADLCAAGIGAPHIRQRLYWVGDAERAGLEGHGRHGAVGRRAQAIGSDTEAGRGGAWADFSALVCSDGNRRVRRGTFPLAHGVPARVGRLRGYGNAIVPQVAATFVSAYLG